MTFSPNPNPKTQEIVRKKKSVKMLNNISVKSRRKTSQFENFQPLARGGS